MRYRHLVFIFFVYITSHMNAYALVNGELIFSKKWITVSTESTEKVLSGYENKASLIFDPIPLIPVGLGLSYSSLNIDNGLAEVVESATYDELNLALVTWLPLFSYEPFMQLSIPVYSKLKFKMKSDNEKRDDGSASGMNLDFGIRKTIFPFVSVILKVGVGIAKIDKFEAKERDFNHKFVGLGVQVGL